jgi:Protein of unknown function (DUF2934)
VVKCGVTIGLTNDDSPILPVSVLSTSCCPRRATRILQRQQAKIRPFRYTGRMWGAWMNSEKQRRIEERAYALWEAEGQLHEGMRNIGTVQRNERLFASLLFPRC